MDFLDKFKKRCNEIKGKETIPILKPDNFSSYEIVKKSGDESKIIAMGLTYKDAITLLNTLHSKLIKKPLNEDGSPLFELELYELTIAGKVRFKDYNQSRFEPDTKWID
jgi:hypothetical protein